MVVINVASQGILPGNVPQIQMVVAQEVEAEGGEEAEDGVEADEVEEGVSELWNALLMVFSKYHVPMKILIGLLNMVK